MGRISVLFIHSLNVEPMAQDGGRISGTTPNPGSMSDVNTNQNKQINK